MPYKTFEEYWKSYTKHDDYAEAMQETRDLWTYLEKERASFNKKLHKRDLELYNTRIQFNEAMRDLRSRLAEYKKFVNSVLNKIKNLER